MSTMATPSEDKCIEGVSDIITQIYDGVLAEQALKLLETHPLGAGEGAELVKHELRRGVERFNSLLKSGEFVEALKNLNGCSPILKKIEEE